MVKEYTHICNGTCSRQITMIYDDETNKIVDLKIIGGCPGNLAGIRRLLIGSDLDEIYDKLVGTKCGAKQTSCPDQIALTIKEIKSL